MRICIDLDGVICQLRKTDEDLLPVSELKDNGHYIIIYTARRMKTHQGNTAKVIGDIGKVTLDWLAKFQIPYDEIMFGKPWADIYIDDNAFRFNSWDDIKGDGSSLPISKEKQVRGDSYGWKRK